ncbi:M48 family metallopeptidase [Arthrobacter sp. H35-D1]|uniref:M48 metallopeptidase family protein n=1 Tax=Arthrobacter sp. H35-D1 TaxID=3046202 RepID=UPI0024B9FE52|nr:M48 family metallopeptidase [Arthrobacter sp. H35-D1]MDJ0314312.1 M48 family metallopeptidase [Arthrobacter sp. H35-D1]
MAARSAQHAPAAAHSPAARSLAAQRRPPVGRGAPGPLGDSFSIHTLSNGERVVVRRTARRKTGLAAFWEAGQAVIAVPARLTLEDEKYWVPRMVAKLEQGTRSQAGRPGIPACDDALMQRSLKLSTKYLGARADPVSVRWVQNQNSRWGSATPARRTIRISHHVQGMPEWVLDYVLLHELAHLIHANHSPAFWAELASYPQVEMAKTFLDGASFAASRNISGMEGGMVDNVDEAVDG